MGFFVGVVEMAVIVHDREELQKQAFLARLASGRGCKGTFSKWCNSKGISRNTGYSLAKQYLSPEINWLYIIQIERYYKIGISKNPNTRLIAIQTDSPFEAKIVSMWQAGITPKRVERHVHLYYEHARVRGEWFHAEAIELDVVEKIVERTAHGTTYSKR